MKRIASALLCVMLICVSAGCGSEHEWEDESEDELEEVDMDSLEELTISGSQREIRYYTGFCMIPGHQGISRICFR